MCQSSQTASRPFAEPARGRSRSEKAYRLCRLWLPRLKPCGVSATSSRDASRAIPRGTALGWLAIVVLAHGAQVAAQETSENPGDDPLARLLEGDTSTTRAGGRLPDPAEAMDAYAAARSCIDSWTAGPNIPTPATAARVALYQRGREIASSSARAETTGETGPLSEAVRDLMDRAGRELAPRGGALADRLLAELAPELVLSLELAGPMTPLSRTELISLDSTISPGLTGLAVRWKDDWSLVFPPELTAGGGSPSVRLAAMAAELLDDPAAGVEMTIDLANRPYVSFYRFETVHIAGVGPDGGPAFLTRGARVVERSEVTTASLIGFAAGLVRHVEATRLPAGSRFGITGTVHASLGTAEPAVATPTQQALVALALARAASAKRLAGETRERARELAGLIAADLAHVEPGEIAPEDDGVACAVLWVVLDELDTTDQPDLVALQQTCESMLARHVAAEQAEPRGTVSEAVLVWALAERAARAGLDRPFAERSLRALLRVTPEGGLVGLMPWIGWAELALAGGDAIPAGVQLRSAREMVWTHQLTLEDTGPAERDLQGGILFTGGGVGLPTWNSARPIALIATMLGDPRLTPTDEVPAEVVRLIDAMRFLMQLSARDDACAFYPRPDLARGGIRAAVWDTRQPPEASALTLLAVVELLNSLDTLAGQNTPAAGRPDSGRDAQQQPAPDTAPQGGEADEEPGKKQAQSP